ncbi:hypothetical protein G9A89_003301 [Geosiphon pyriformis]|nr:hypothetical protein G9A89_003301 [Geosiphon pyriformis]
MARKILFKVLSDKIFFTCSKFGVLHGDNFSVLKGISTQVLVFAVGLGLKMFLRRIRNFGWFCKICVRHMTLLVGTVLRINKRIFYDLLLCEVKRHEHLCEYQIDTKFVAKLGRVESGDRMFSFFAAGTFVDNTIWVEDCQASIQYALNIASKFFTINDISINNEKTVAILINQGVKITSLNINGQPISIAERDKTHRYLGIFLSTEGLSKPSLAKTHSDVCFFVNIVLRKTITNKQFSYLVSAILQPIVNYHTQFSFVSSNVCCKWDALVRKGLKLKAGLLHDFLNAALYHLLLYGLKSFEQIQVKSKLATVVVFSNASGILGHLFNHRFLDLQVLDWALLDPLHLMNNFLAGVVKILLGNKLSLMNNLPCAFCGLGNFPMSLRLDPRGPVPHWFEIISRFLHDGGALLSGLAKADWLSDLDILASKKFSDLHSSLHELWSGSFVIYMDGLLKDYGSSGVTGGVAAYFPTIDYSIGVRVHGLLSSTLTELQAVALVLECVPSFSTVLIHFDSQAAIDACVSELSLLVPDF